MRSLVLLNLEDNPEFEGLELQLFDDEVKGKGAAAIMWHTDKRGDFYVTPGVTLDIDKIEVSGGVGEIITQDFHYKLDINSYGVDAHVSLTLKDGRPVDFWLSEKRPKVRKPLTILAPVGGVTSNPGYFPVFHLQDIDLVQRQDSNYSFKIADNNYHPPKIPVPMPYSGKLVYFLRYCSDPVMGLLNMQYDGELTALKPEHNVIFKHRNTSYIFKNREGYFEIQKVSVVDNEHNLYITFSPTIPDIVNLKDGVSIRGRFDIGVDDTSDLIQGVYQIRREEKSISMEMYPDRNWKPRGSLLQRLTLFCFPPEFRTWIKTYHWKATIQEEANHGRVTMKSGWQRTT